jgi:hypothetical protein
VCGIAFQGPIFFQSFLVKIARALYFTAISYDFVLSSTGTVTDQTSLDSHSIGVNFGNRGFTCNSSTNVVIVGVVKQGIIGTIVYGDQPTIIYYIEEQSVLLF